MKRIGCSNKGPHSVCRLAIGHEGVHRGLSPVPKGRKDPGVTWTGGIPYEEWQLREKAAIVYVEKSGTGNHRVCYGVPGQPPIKWGEWSSYQGLARMRHDGETFYGATLYYDGVFPTEKAFTVTVVE